MCLFIDIIIVQGIFLVVNCDTVSECFDKAVVNVYSKVD